ncbi:MAG: hypothetical protein LRY71_18150 [Bacillaceae bacterium]|nr:hypothetical protein [Bacillaceae bacterium]
MITLGYIVSSLLLLALVFTIDYFLFDALIKESMEIGYMTEFMLGLDKLILFFIFGLIFAIIQDYRSNRKMKREV